MNEKKQKQLAEAIKDALRIGLILIGLCPLAIIWQLWRNADLGAHLVLNVSLLVLGWFGGIWHLAALLHGLIVVFSYDWRDDGR